MKAGNCARCGSRILVPNYFDPGEDMFLCVECEEQLDREWLEDHPPHQIEDTRPL